MSQNSKSQGRADLLSELRSQRVWRHRNIRATVRLTADTQVLGKTGFGKRKASGFISAGLFVVQFLDSEPQATRGIFTLLSKKHRNKKFIS